MKLDVIPALPTLIGRCHSRSDLLNSPEPAVVKADTSDLVAGNEMIAGTAAMSALRQ